SEAAFWSPWWIMEADEAPYRVERPNGPWPRGSRPVQGFRPWKGSGLEGLLPFAGATQIIHNLSSRKRSEGRSDFRRTERSRTKARRDRRDCRSKARFHAPSFRRRASRTC